MRYGLTYCDTLQAGFSAISDQDILDLRSGDFYAVQVFDRPIDFTLRGGYDTAFTDVVGISTIHGSFTVALGSVVLDNIAIGAAPPPMPGNYGSLAAVGITATGTTLQYSTASSKLPGADLSYRIYYSDTHVLANVADIEAFGTAFGGYFTASGTGWVGGKIGNALFFSGSDYVDAGNGPSLSFGTGSFSVEAWVNPSSWNGDTPGIVGKGASEASESGYALRQVLWGTDKHFQFVLGNGSQQVAVSQKGYTENQWYHLVGVADRENDILTLYINGVEAAGTSLVGFIGSTDSSVHLTIGKQYQSVVGQDRFFQGIIDEVALYSRPLTAAEVADRYNSGSGMGVAPVNGLSSGWPMDEGSGTAAADISGAGNLGALNFFLTTDISGLADLTTYSITVLVTDQYGNSSTYNPATVDTPLLLIAFTGSLIPYDMFCPLVADFNNDGYIEPLGTYNDGAGNLSPVSSESMGIEALFAAGRIQRTCNSADFNGDGLPDLVCNVFSAYEPYTGSDPVCQMMAEQDPYSANSVAMLFFNNGGGTFTENTAFTGMALRGLHGETILVADFNNDGCLDIFWPQATSCSPNEQNYLLINDCYGNFSEIADAAGVAMRNTDINYRGEGAQAVDLDLDGWIDIYVGSHMFMNNGSQGIMPTFTDRREAMGLPLAFDEGIKFTDWNNDGYLDLIIHHPYTGPALYQFNGVNFFYVDAIPAYSFTESYGLNVFDMNNDGLEDIIVSGGSNVAGVPDPTVVYLNNRSGFERSNPTPMDAWGEDVISFGDIDYDGRLDVLKREVDSGGYGLAYFRNITQTPVNSYFIIDVRGPSGQRNQQGRVVNIYPLGHPDVVFTRFVDSGSGYLTQSPYEIFVGTPFTETHHVDVHYADGTVSFNVNPGERVRVYSTGFTQFY